MRHLIIGSALGIVSATTLFCATAGAQEERRAYWNDRIAAPSGAFELGVGTGYSQGLGMVAPNRGFPSVAGPGLGVTAQIDYRLNPHWSVGIEGQYQELQAEQNTSARSLAGNLGATYHFAPVMRGDPWVRLGTGYRMVWETHPNDNPNGTPMRHGFELGAAKVGYDVRVSEDVAISPVIGADLTMYLWQDQSGAADQTYKSAQLGTFIYGGLQGRFDIGGSRVGVATAKAEPVMLPVIPGPTPEPAPPPPAPPPIAAPTPVTNSIAVSDDIMKQCTLDLGAIDKAPKFEFNQSDLEQADLAILKQIADCFSTGPMKGQSMQLVGHADPRGSDEYNQKLGLKRADSVATFLEQNGVSSEKIDEKSRGKQDATGHDEATWANDRRVHVLAK